MKEYIILNKRESDFYLTWHRAEKLIVTGLTAILNLLVKGFEWIIDRWEEWKE